jgi:aryl-alcohol dehydrogenase-like predicted oxidoreductase
VAKETRATANQVVLSWLTGGELPVVALIGASSVAQLEESVAAVDLADLQVGGAEVGRHGVQLSAARPLPAAW